MIRVSLIILLLFHFIAQGQPRISANDLCPGATITVHRDPNLYPFVNIAGVLWRRDSYGFVAFNRSHQPDGQVIAGDDATSSAFLDEPYDVHVHNYSTYVLERNYNRVRSFPTGWHVIGGAQGSLSFQLNRPEGFFVDAQGNIYVADTYNHRVQRWAAGASGAETVAGTGKPGSGLFQLKYPTDVFVDAAGKIYICDSGNDRIQKWTLGSGDGGVTVAGGNGQGSAMNQLNTPKAVSIDESGNVFVADSRNHRIQKWIPGASQGVTVAGGNGAGNALNKLNTPVGIFVKSGAVYIADSANHRIQRWDAGATTGVRVAGEDLPGEHVGALFGPTSVIVLDNNDLLVTDAKNNRVQKWSSGVASVVAGTANNSSAVNRFDSPHSAFIDVMLNDLYVADGHNHRVQKWPLNGGYGPLTVAGGNGAGSGANQLSDPSGVFVDGSGNIWVADKNNHRIQKILAYTKEVVTVAGGNGEGSAANQLSYPYSVFVRNGDIYISDQGNHRVQKWAANSTSGVTVAGGNGYGSNANQLKYPGEIYVDSEGNIFVVDAHNGRVQKWEPGAASGTTVAGGGTDDANRLDFPWGMHVDERTQSIYVADQGNHRIQRWVMVIGETEGTTVIGGKGIGTRPEQVPYPMDVLMDYDSNLYVVDTRYNRVKKWKFEIPMTFIAQEPGTYRAEIFYDYYWNLPSEESNDAFIYEPSAKPSIVMPDALSVCEGKTVTLTSSPGSKFQWNRLGTPIWDATGNTFEATTSGAYSVTVTDPSTYCPATSDFASVNILPLPKVISSTSGQFCSPTGTAMLSASADSGSITWYDQPVNGVKLYTGSLFTTTQLTTNTTFYAEAVNSIGCVSDSRTAVTATAKPSIDVSLSVFANTLTVGESDATYQWHDCNKNNAPIAGATTKSFDATSDGKFGVTVTKDGCTVLSDCYEFSFTSIESLEHDQLRVYPNPFNEYIIIEHSPTVQEQIHVQLINSLGQVVYNNLLVDTNTLALPSLTSGAYSIRVVVGNKIVNKKLLKI